MDTSVGFYIGLVSNESFPDYPQNTLSAFTNKLAKAIQLDGDDWVVGLTSISFPKYETFQRLQAIEEVDNTVETFTPITVNDQQPPKKKRRRREYRKLKQTIEKKIVIKASATHTITLKESDIVKLTYKKSHLNCGILLETLGEKIDPQPDKSDQVDVLRAEVLKRSIKNDLFAGIDSNIWNSNDEPVKPIRHKDEFFVHVYQNSRKANVIILKYGEYSSLNEFVAFLVKQLPVECRTIGKLKPLFNMFHSTYNLLDEKVEIVRPDTMINLFLPFKEYGAGMGLNTIELMMEKSNILTDGVSLDRVIELFRDNLTYQEEDQPLSSAAKLALRTMIKEKIVDSLRLENAMDIPFSSQSPGKYDMILNMPIEKVGQNYNTYKIVLAARDYSDANDLLNSVIAQIPRDKRNREVFIAALEESFVRALKLKIKTSEVNDMTTSADHMGQSTSNAPATSFQWPVDVMQRQTTPSPTQSQSTPPAQPQSTATPPVKPQDPATPNDTTTSTDFEEIVASRKDPHKNGFLYVYSDIIKSRIIGEQTIRCLRVIPLTDTGMRNIQFTTVEYLPVQNNYIETISILLSNSFGDQIHFLKSKMPTFCMLHFKRA